MADFEKWVQKRFGKPSPDEDAAELTALRRRVAVLERRQSEAPPDASPPPPIDLMAPGSPKEDMSLWRRAHGLPDDPSVMHYDRPLAAASPNAAGLAKLERERAERLAAHEARTAELALDAVNLRGASQGKTRRRLEQLGVTDPEVLAAVREPAADQPLLDPNAAQRERLAKARREISNAKKIAGAFKEPVDFDDLSPLAQQLFKEERGWSPSDVEVLGGAAGER